MTIDEIVTSRLISRGVADGEIEWDAIRHPGTPWILLARYRVAGNDVEARWQVNSKARFITPLNDEATWLTDTPIPAPNDPWRPLNTPQVNEINAVRGNQIDPDPASPAETDRNASAEIQVPAQNDASATPAIDIDAMLASLDEQRGISRPAPSIDTDPAFAGAHPAYSEPENATDAQILQFPTARAANSAQNLQEAQGDSAPASTPNQQTEQALPGFENTRSADSPQNSRANGEKAKNKARRGRPEMPSWDEIIYGYSKDSD
ncbi:septation protein SepH [Arcanobacterium hippocoleae]